MLSERQPLGELDPNVPRVQPSRAAKTGHKWFGMRRPKNSHDFDTCSTRLGCFQLKNGAKPNQLSSQTQHCDNHNSAVAQSDIYRPPFRLLSGNNNVDIDGKKASNDDMHRSHYFPPLHVSQPSVESMSMDTACDASFRSVNDSDLADDADLSCGYKSASRSSRHKQPEEPPFLGKIHVKDDYVVDILTCMKITEVRYLPNPGYLDEQSEITAPMRVKLVDWLVEVQDEYKLHNETLHLAVSYVDRFLSTMSVARAKLQLLGTTAMFLAAKFEEIYPPDADEFAYVTADTYSRSEVLMMERLILRVFEYRLAVPTPHQYLMIFSEKAGLCDEIVFLSHYLCELALLDEKYLKYPPSIRAAASLTLAWLTITQQANSTIRNLNEFIKNAVNRMTQSDTSNSNTAKSESLDLPLAVRQCLQDNLPNVYECTNDLAKTHREEFDRHQSFVHEKYSAQKLKCVAKFRPIPATDGPAFLSRKMVTCIWMT